MSKEPETAAPPAVAELIARLTLIREHHSEHVCFGVCESCKTLQGAATLLSQQGEQLEEAQAWKRWAGGRKPTDPLLLDYNQMILEVKQAESSLRAMREALEKFGAHAYGCPWAVEARIHKNMKPCNCGLDAALALSSGDTKERS